MLRVCVTLLTLLTFLVFAQPVGAIKHRSHANDEVIILILSGRDHFEQRAAIRDTWASGFSFVKFVIGSDDCMVPPDYRVAWSCDINEAHQRPSDAAMLKHLADVNYTRQRLRVETATFDDIVIVPMIDSYRNLPVKLFNLYRWALEHTAAQWLVKLEHRRFFPRSMDPCVQFWHHNA